MSGWKLIKVFTLILVFILGFLFANILNIGEREGIFSYILGRVTDVNNNLPSDYLDNDDFLVYDDKIVLKIENAKISNYESNSMEPFLGEGANGIVIKPNSEEEINIGDIVTFRRGDKLIVHRVIEKGADEDGLYFITKGDNSDFSDGKVRFKEIEHKLVGIVY